MCVQLNVKQDKFKHSANSELPQEKICRYLLSNSCCSVSCPFLYLGCVHSQFAGEANAATAEPHLTNRLAPAGG